MIQDAEEQKQVNQPSYDPLYKIIWEADACPKIQHFLWKCLSGCIPVTERLKAKHIAKDASCPRCHEPEESVNHLLFQCPFARLVWAISPIPAPPNGDMGSSFQAHFYRIMTCIPKYPAENETGKIAPWIMWRLWKNRNDYAIKGIEYGAEETLNKVMDDMEEWRGRVKEEETSKIDMPRVPEETVWTPPPQDWLKCNVDGAWKQQEDSCGVGWILRDHNGKALWLGARKLPKLLNSMETEAEALRWAIWNVRRFNYRKLIFESDSQVVVRALNGTDSRPCLSPWIQDCQAMLRSFDAALVCFHGRSGNKVADKIAKEAASLEYNVSKLYSIMPNWISEVIKEDSPTV